MLYIRKDKISDLLSARIYISHATIDKAKTGEDELENMIKYISTLNNQVNIIKDLKMS
jgi:hypothetical protein